jgi:hypothetical protein
VWGHPAKGDARLRCAATAICASRHSQGALGICYNMPRCKRAVPWEPEAAKRFLAATVAAVRAARQGALCQCHAPARAGGTASDARPPLAQGARVLSRQMRTGGRGHPLRALETGVAQPATPGRAWAAISRYADPVVAYWLGAYVLDTAAWQWAVVPANFARAVLDSGALRHIRRVVELGAAHAGRCAAARRPRRSAPLACAVTRGAATRCRARRAAARARVLGGARMPPALAHATLPPQRARRGAPHRSDRIWCVSPRRRSAV